MPPYLIDMLPLSRLAPPSEERRLRPAFDRELPQALFADIARIGVLVPPLVEIRDDGQGICHSGNRRCAAALELGWKQIPCLILRQASSQLNHWLCLARHAATGAQLSPVQQARLRDQAANVLQQEELDQLLTAMGLKAQRQTHQQLASIAQLSPALLRPLHAGCIPLKNLARLLRLPQDDQLTVAGLITEFQLGGSKQHRLLEAAHELARRHGTPFSMLLEQWRQRYQGLGNGPQQVTSLFQWLEEQCSPRCTAADKEISAFIRELALPPHIRVQTEPNHESEQVELIVRYADRQRLQEEWRLLRKTLVRS
jgi:ParB-like chromosome segregation protein Spo0J